MKKLKPLLFCTLFFISCGHNANKVNAKSETEHLNEITFETDDSIYDDWYEQESADIDIYDCSGKYYITLQGTLEASFYTSYEEHSTFTRTSPLAATEIRPCNVDFKNGLISINGKNFIIKIISTDIKEYYTYTSMWGDGPAAYNIYAYLDVFNSSIKMEFEYHSGEKTAHLYVISGDDPAFISEYFLVKDVKQK